MKKTIFSILIFFCFFLFLGIGAAHAEVNAKLPVITVINPIRGNDVGHDHENLLPGLQAQWNVTKQTHISATWLWQYSALDNQPLVAFAKKNMINQEFGLFLEIDRNLTQNAYVQYRGRGPWYFSDGLLLVSYDQTERRKLIDTAFTRFKQTFGYYPKTVGAWWIGADSLDYMQKKYGITGAMRAADQFNLDAYTIWGTPWSIPYIASRENEGIPADSFETSSQVVIMQWAARDPTQGYGNSSDNSTYSIQDFSTKGYDFSYVDYLFSIFLHQPLDQLVIGLENNASPAIYADNSYYQKMLTKAAELQKQGKLTIASAQEYAHMMLENKQLLPPTHYFLTKDYKTDEQSFWYNAPTYRIGIRKEGNNVYLLDLRKYTAISSEPFTILPNSQGMLRINTPALIDASYLPQQKKLLATSSQPMMMRKQGSETVVTVSNQTLGTFTDSTFHIRNTNSKQITSSVIQPLREVTYTNTLSTLKRINFFWILFTLFFVYSLLLIVFAQNKKRFLISSLALFIPLLTAYSLLHTNQAWFFDKKELLLSPLLRLVFGPLWLRMLLVFQFGPFFLLFVLHVFCQRWLSQKIFFGYALILTWLYLHVPYFPLDKSTFLFIGVTGGSIICILGLLGGILFIQKRQSLQSSVWYALSTCAVLCALLGIIVMSRSTYVLVPFELDALQTIAQEQTDVIYVVPTDTPIYKAVRPILYDNFHVAAELTHTHWQWISRNQNNILSLQNTANKVIVVPRYLGSEIYSEEEKKFKLQKIFDNAEIAIYEGRR